MSDPAVCCFLTKTLCAHGGRLGLPELRERIGLSAQQLEETLSAAGPQRFLVLRDDDGGGRGAEVLAVSAVRTCVRKECGGCDRLHLCKLHLMGRCNLGPRSCKYLHDIINAENKKVLKTHELSGLNEDELRVLLLQNDPFLLPDVCQFYNRKDSTCSQQNNCNRLHICRHFLQGECRFVPCKRSHNLLDTHALRVLETGGVDRNIASNIQAICDHKHVEFNKELKKGKIHNYKPRENALKKTAVRSVKDSMMHLQTVDSTLHVPPSEGPSSNVPGQSQHQLPTGAGSKDKDKKDDSSAKASKDNKQDKCDDICVFYVWKYCRHKDKCRFVHYHLPYRWQVYNGITWNDLSMTEEIEKAYCDPKNSSIADKNINFQTMTCRSSSLRRLSTPSSVTKPTLLLTTQWIWYWKNDQGQWIEYGQQGEGNSVNSPSSAIIENLYLADPDATISFQAGSHHYQLNFKEMTQTNISFKTRRKVCRRPKFVSSEDVQKIRKGQRDSSIPNQVCPVHWDQSALPDLGYKAVEVSNTTSEYNRIKQLFHQTMKSYKVLKIQRIQNPSLWKVFQWQKEQMKRENGGKEVSERLLFHGTKISFVEAICVHNFDWRICGSNGTNYGKGSYFARDASYSHAYCQPAVKTNIMFVARVLVGDYVKGNAAYVRPPTKSVDGLRFYDSCVDNELNPSIFVVFEKYQIYPEYTIEYKEEAEKCIVS
ncbi:zinc finger CCCH-type antiviral protein 1-like isoform X1 [Harpia harpyja]|uniref:zinc finger CCCH-type antiviral protein 1-like isoform X1 n=1 Tax=Harpia harpyja TaxID=202280 RepID=UPI0022B19272|nr:zinc finger CCCH-type antiviral protein 1-like isoform X1 [Harpia harpyja]